MAVRLRHRIVECVADFAYIGDNAIMSDTDQRKRAPIATRIDSGALETIERLAEQRRTTPAQVARTLLEDGARALAESAA